MSATASTGARGYSWPRAEPGNTIAQTHGAHNSREVEPRAQALAPAIFEANPHLSLARDGAGVYRYAVILARIERVLAWLGEQADPVFTEESTGKVHGVYERLERWERAADAAEDRLAISPLARAKLGIDTLRGQTLTELLAAAEAATEEAGEGS